MIHEPECQCSPKFTLYVGGTFGNEKVCICAELRYAYQRGREDAAQEILTEPTVVMFDEEHPNGDCWLRRNDAYVAARGDGEQA